MSKKFTKEEVGRHSTKDSCWIIIKGKVYDVTKFASLHPGGRRVLSIVAGKDASKEFEVFHRPSTLKKYERLCIGEIEDHKQVIEFIPYAEPSYFQHSYSPYYKESHRKFRNALKSYVELNLLPYVFDWEENMEVPQEVRVNLYQAGLLPCVVGYWPKEYFPNEKILDGVVKPEEWDMFHNLVFTDELSKTGSFGVIGNIITTLAIAVSPIIHFGSKYLQDKVVRPCLSGEKMICLGITGISVSQSFNLFSYPLLFLNFFPSLIFFDHNLLQNHMVEVMWVE